MPDCRSPGLRRRAGERRSAKVLLRSAARIVEAETPSPPFVRRRNEWVAGPQLAGQWHCGRTRGCIQLLACPCGCGSAQCAPLPWLLSRMTESYKEGGTRAKWNIDLEDSII